MHILWVRDARRNSMVKPELAFYIEEYNKAGDELREAGRNMDKWRKMAKDKFDGIDIANDRSIN